MRRYFEGALLTTGVLCIVILRDQLARGDTQIIICGLRKDAINAGQHMARKASAEQRAAIGNTLGKTPVGRCEQQSDILHRRGCQYYEIGALDALCALRVSPSDPIGSAVSIDEHAGHRSARFKMRPGGDCAGYVRNQWIRERADGIK